MNLARLAQQLIDGNITLAQWQAEMRAFILVIHREAAILAAGGRDNMTPALWGYLGSLVKKQYQYLDGFAADIAANPDVWFGGKLLARMNLYAKADFGTFEAILKKIAMLNGMTHERRLLGGADHCRCCLAQAALGWQPIGTLLNIGKCDCVTNCHCTFEYARIDAKEDK